MANGVDREPGLTTTSRTPARMSSSKNEPMYKPSSSDAFISCTTFPRRRKFHSPLFTVVSVACVAITFVACVVIVVVLSFAFPATFAEAIAFVATFAPVP